MFKLSPSILSADFSILKDQIAIVENGGAQLLHIDVMDGHFVPNISFGAPIIASIRPHSNAIFDTHLMIANPENYIESFAKAGSDIITVHVESTNHIDRCIDLIHECGKKAGVSLNPATDLSVLDYIIEKLDMVLLMSVNPGFGGQKLISYTTKKIADLRKKVGKDFDIEIDGGVDLKNCAMLVECGANVLVAGSAIFGSDDILSTTKEFMKLGNTTL